VVQVRDCWIKYSPSRKVGDGGVLYRGGNGNLRQLITFSIYIAKIWWHQDLSYGGLDLVSTILSNIPSTDFQVQRHDY
jgi:hypothetical protein